MNRKIERESLKILRLDNQQLRNLSIFTNLLGDMEVMKSKRIHDFLPEIKDYYVITSDGEIYSDNSGLMKTRNKGNTDYQIINLMR